MLTRPRLAASRVTVALATLICGLAFTASSSQASPAAEAAARRSLPEEVTISDGKDSKADWDIREVYMRSEHKDHELAVLSFTFADAPDGDDALAVYWNLDKDSKPDMLMYPVGSEFEVSEMSNWDKSGKDITAKGCVGYYGDGKEVTILFDPACLGKSTRFQINALTYNQQKGLDKADYLPAKRKWTKAVDSVVPYPPK